MPTLTFLPGGFRNFSKGANSVPTSRYMISTFSQGCMDLEGEVYSADRGHAKEAKDLMRFIHILFLDKKFEFYLWCCAVGTEDS